MIVTFIKTVVFLLAGGLLTFGWIVHAHKFVEPLPFYGARWEPLDKTTWLLDSGPVGQTCYFGGYGPWKPRKLGLAMRQRIDDFTEACAIFLESGKREQIYELAEVALGDEVLPQLSNLEFCRALYRTLLGREAEPGGAEGWASTLDFHTYSRDEVVVWFIRSDEWMQKHGLRKR